MGKFKDKKADEDFKEMMEPTRAEVEDLRLKLTKYQQIRINGKLQTKFEQYCKTFGVVSFNEFGSLVIHNAEDYTRLRKINEKLESRQYLEREEYLKTHPEEREEMRQQFSEMNKIMSLKFGITHE